MKSGVGALTLSNSNSFSGGTVLNDGTLILNNVNALGTGNNNIVVNGGRLSLNGFAATLTSLAAGSSLILENNAAAAAQLTANLAANSTFNGLIRDGAAGALSLTKSGAGTLTLVTANTFTGATTISAGTLQIFAETGLGTNPSAFNAGQLTINGGGLQTSNSFAIDDANRGVAIGASGATFSPDANTKLTLSTAISGTGAGTVTMAGAGTLVLSGTNSWTAATASGALTIASGVVQFSSDDNFGNSANGITFGNGTTGGSLEFIGSTTTTVASTRLITSNAATINLIANGTNGAEVIFGQIGTTANSLNLSGSGVGSIGNWLETGTVALTKSGTGTWKMTAATTSAAATDYDITVNGGVLELNVTNAFVGDDITIGAGGTMRLGAVNAISSMDLLNIAGGGVLDVQSFANSGAGVAHRRHHHRNRRLFDQQ